MNAYTTYINHIMFQPVFDCHQGCAGCYVQASESSLYRGPFKKEVFELVYYSNKVKCNQFTLALDPVNPNNSLYKECITPIKNVINLYKLKYIDGIEENRSLPKLCVTAFNWESLEVWRKALEFTSSDFYSILSIVSLSNLPLKMVKMNKVKTILNKSNTSLNYNYMVPFDDDSLKELKQGNLPPNLNPHLDSIDQMYLVLGKSALGEYQSEQALQTWILARKLLKNKLGDKLINDICVMDSINFNCTNTPCTAGKTKIHIWPDGKVTSCPYDSHHIHHGKEHEVNLFSEIKRAANCDRRPAIAFCDIPNALKQL